MLKLPARKIPEAPPQSLLVRFTHAAIRLKTMLTVGVDIQSQYDSRIQVRIGEHSQTARRGYQPISCDLGLAALMSVARR
jgi:hypothetical protein